MITVNLRPGKRRKSRGSPFNFKGMLDGFRDLGTKVKDPLLLGAVGGWVCVLGFLGFVYLNNVRQLYSLEPRLEQARSEHKRFKAFIADKRRQETIRDSLLAQITVIRNVDGDRYIWAHVLDEVTKALPAYTWLVDIGTSVQAVAATKPAAGAKADTTADTTAAAGSGVSAQRPHHRHPGVYPLPPSAGSIAVDHGRDPGFGHDGRGERAAGDGVQHPRHVCLGGLGLYPRRSLQPVGEVR